MGISNINNNKDLSNIAGSMLSGASSKRTPTLFDYLDDSGSLSSSGDISDILDISPQAQVAADKLNGSSQTGFSSLFGTSADGLQIENFQEAADQAFENVQSKLTKLFKEKHIDTSKEIKLQVGADGQVIVANNHPQKAAIEQLFKDDPSLRDEYVKFTAFSEMVAAGQEAEAFQQAYAKNPVAAVAKYSYLFDTKNKGMLSMSILGDKYQSIFERNGKEAVVLSISMPHKAFDGSTLLPTHP